MRKRRNSGPFRFARDFSSFLAREGLRRGKVRILPASSLVAWAEKALRKSQGDMERLAKEVALWMRLHLYGAAKLDPGESERLREEARAFSRRHRFILAEQVLAGDGSEVSEDGAKRILLRRAK